MLQRHAIKAFSTPHEFLQAVFSARGDSDRLSIVYARLKQSGPLVSRLSNRDIAIVALMASAPRIQIDQLSPEDFSQAKEKIAFSAVPNDQHAEEISKFPRSIEEAAKQFEESLTQARHNYAFHQTLKSELFAEYSELQFLISSTWAGLLFHREEIRKAYGDLDPIETISAFFGTFFFGDQCSTSPSGGPIPESCAALLSEMTMFILDTKVDQIDSEFSILCDVALGRKRLAAVAPMLGGLDDIDALESRHRSHSNYRYVQDRSPDEKQLGDFLATSPPFYHWFEVNLALVCFSRLLSDFEYLDNESEISADACAEEVELTRRFFLLFRFLLGRCEDGNSAKFVEHVYSMESVINNAQLRLVPDLSKLSACANEFMRKLRTDLIEEDLEDNDKDDIDKDLLWPRITNVTRLAYILPTLEHAERLASEIFESAFNNAAEAPFWMLGTYLPYSPPRGRYKPIRLLEAIELKLPVDLISEVYGGYSANGISGPADPTDASALDLAERLVDLGLDDVAACHLAMWIELQGVVKGGVVGLPLDIAKVASRLPVRSAGIIDIAVARVNALQPETPNLLLTSVFPRARRLGPAAVGAESSVRNLLGESAWELLHEDSRGELVAAEEYWFSIRDQYRDYLPETGNSVRSFRGAFASWGPMVEREWKRALYPFLILLEDCKEEELNPYLIRMKAGRCGLNDMINFIPRYKANLRPKDRFLNLINAIEESELKRDVFEKPRARRNWEEIGDQRNFALHDNAIQPSWEDVVMVRLYLLKGGLLRELVHAAKSLQSKVVGRS